MHTCAYIHHPSIHPSIRPSIHPSIHPSSALHCIALHCIPYHESQELEQEHVPAFSSLHPWPKVLYLKEKEKEKGREKDDRKKRSRHVMWVCAFLCIHCCVKVRSSVCFGSPDVTVCGGVMRHLIDLEDVRQIAAMLPSNRHATTI